MPLFQIMLQVIAQLLHKLPTTRARQVNTVPCPQAILKRYLKYIRNLETKRSPKVRIMINSAKYDIRSPTGSNVHNLVSEFSGAIFDDNYLLTGARPVVIPEEDEWKIPLLERLLEERLCMRMNDDVTDSLTSHINMICTSSFS